MKYWEIEIECDDTWSINSIFSFFVEQENKPTIEDMKNIYDIHPNYDGLGNIVRITELSENEYNWLAF